MKFAIFALLAATIVAAAPGGEPAAAPAAAPVGGSTSNVWNKTEKKCNVGKLQCCETIQTAKEAQQQNLNSPIGAALGSLNGLVGLNCNPIAGAIGLNGVNCNASPACCSGNKMNGLITAGCNPVNING